jgi:hypothetical protein
MEFRHISAKQIEEVRSGLRVSSRDGRESVLNISDCGTNGDLTSTSHEPIQNAPLGVAKSNGIQSDVCRSQLLQLVSRNRIISVGEEHNTTFIPR